MEKLLRYLDATFDEWEEGYDDDNNKTYWTNICPTCAERHDNLEADIDFETGSFACCGMSGCNYSGEHTDSGTYYIDLDPYLVEFDYIDYEVEYPVEKCGNAYEGGFPTIQAALDSEYVRKLGGYKIHRRFWKTPLGDSCNNIETCEVAWDKSKPERWTE